MNNLHKNKFSSLYTQVSRIFNNEEKVFHVIVSYMPQPLHIHVLQQNYMPPFDFQCGPNTCCPTNSKTKWFISRFKYVTTLTNLLSWIKLITAWKLTKKWFTMKQKVDVTTHNMFIPFTSFDYWVIKLHTNTSYSCANLFRNVLPLRVAQ
jgi:hypothetical protein